MAKLVKFACIIQLLLMFLCMPQKVQGAESVEYDNISIGGGGAFFEPLINPADSENYVVFSDMNNLYYSLNGGDNWECTETKIPFYLGDFSEDGSTLFMGGSGIYASYDKGRSIQLIYPHPDTVKISVSRLGRNDDNILADGFDNGYAVCLDAYGDRVYFITLDWQATPNMRILGCNADGTELEVYYSAQCTDNTSPSSANYNMIADAYGIYYSDGTKIYYYDFSIMTVAEVFTAEGQIKDFQKIEDTYFILDDVSTSTKILYTKNFKEYGDLKAFNKLPNSFEKKSETYYFEWHFTVINGNNLDNVFLSFASPVDSAADVGSYLGGVLKYDGKEFQWVYDPVFQPRSTYSVDGWAYGAYNPIYGIGVDSKNDGHCLVTDLNSVYDIYYNESYKNVESLHGKTIKYDGEKYYSTTGLNCQHTYWVKEDPFNSEHLIICTTDLGLQISYDGGNSFKWDLPSIRVMICILIKIQKKYFQTPLCEKLI